MARRFASRPTSLRSSSWTVWAQIVRVISLFGFTTQSYLYTKVHQMIGTSDVTMSRVIEHDPDWWKSDDEFGAEFGVE